LHGRVTFTFRRDPAAGLSVPDAPDTGKKKPTVGTFTVRVPRP